MYYRKFTEIWYLILYQFFRFMQKRLRSGHLQFKTRQPQNLMTLKLNPEKQGPKGGEQWFYWYSYRFLLNVAGRMDGQSDGRTDGQTERVIVMSKPHLKSFNLPTGKTTDWLTNKLLMKENDLVLRSSKDSFRYYVSGSAKKGNVKSRRVTA